MTETITRAKWISCPQIRYKYECNYGGADGEEYTLKPEWARNGSTPNPIPRATMFPEDTAATQRRIDRESRISSSQRTMVRAVRSGCVDCDAPTTKTNESKYGNKHGSYARYLLKKKGITV